MAGWNRATGLFVTVCLGLTTPAHSAWNEWFFTTYLMPDQNFACKPPSVCAYDGLLDKYYCCDFGSSDAVCWAEGYNCSISAGSMQKACGAGFCCLNDREDCSAKPGQANICWSTATNPIANVSGALLNETFTSLSASQPSSTAELTLNVTSLLEVAFSTSSTSASSSSTASITSSTTSTASPATSPVASLPASSSATLSGGAIAGIAIGGATVLAIAGAAVWVFGRRKRRAVSSTPLSPPPPSYVKDSHPTEMATNYNPIELSVSGPAELSGRYFAR